MIFETNCYGRVRLDRGVAGDATKWFVETWHNGGWSCEDATIEPCDLRGEPLAESAEADG